VKEEVMLLTRPGKIRVGTSGWNYDHWRKNFYPQELQPTEWLDYYARRLSTVEINNSFYNLPSAKTFRKWADTVPESFLFAVKASRYITHMKKLKDPEEPLKRFLGRVEYLRERRGPILFQLPPRWRVNTGRLREFLDHLPDDCRATFEFRDTTWWNDEVYRVLEDYKVAFCIYHLAGVHSPEIMTSDFVYIRLHGPGAAYQGLYDKQTLTGWAGAISAWAGAGKEVYCYFDNDQDGYAARNAMELRELTEQ
jgi:uncharacterized protein YecE (DUF72 family)